MSLAISSTTTAACAVTPSKPVSAAGSNQSTDQTSRTQQQSALSQLVTQYRGDVQQGESTASLQSIANRINSDARALGQNVVLPSASSGTASTTGDATAAAAQTGSANKLDTIA